MILTGLVLLAVIYSGLLVFLLGLADPKRARVNRRQPALVLPRPVRRAVWVLVLLPAGLFLASSQLAYFVLWLGGVVVLGWLTAALLPYLSSHAE